MDPIYIYGTHVHRLYKHPNTCNDDVRILPVLYVAYTKIKKLA